jgi:CBS domain-containing protein
MTVASILKHKGARVETVQSGATVRQVCDVLSSRKIGAVIVQGAGGALLGVVSERDVVQAISQKGEAALSTRVDQIMTREVATCRLTDHAEDLMSMMTVGRFRHVPVVEGGQLVGIVSIGDIVKRSIEDSELERTSMRAYISQAG